MPNDLLIYELFNLPHLVAQGILAPLGGQRYQFTSAYLHNPIIYPKPSVRPSWKIELSGKWAASAGAIIHLLDRSGPAPTVQIPGQQSYAFQFEISSAYEGYAGPVRYLPDDAPVTPIVEAGPNQQVQSGAVVQLEGKLNPTIADQRMPFYWIQTSGPVVTLSDKRSLRPSFRAPVVSVVTVLAFRLLATDGGQDYGDSVTITVSP